MQRQLPAGVQELDLDIGGSTTFGRYPKISVANSTNFILSDDWNVPYGGHKLVKMFVAEGGGTGRGAYTSFPSKKMLLAIANRIFWVGTNFSSIEPGVLNTFSGPVYIVENEKNEIAICDLRDIWIYNYIAGTFAQANLDFIPSYVAYQDGTFIAGVLGSPQWRLCSLTDSTAWPFDSQHVGVFNEADTVVAAVPFPSRANLLFVMGTVITEPWYNLGLPLFPYQRSQSFNVDYGTINAATIAGNDNMLVWIAQNGKSQSTLYYSTGGDGKRITTDGISFLFDNLKAPQDCYGNLFQQNNHLLYQFTYPTDNLCFVYDFNTSKFFTITDEYLNYHIMRKVTLFNGNNYFVSNTDGGLYEFGTQFNTYNGQQIPRIRICSSIRNPNSRPFICREASFTIEMGQDDFYNPQEAAENYPRPVMRPAADLSISVDGGNSFGSFDRVELNAVGNGQNRLAYYNMGYANEMVHQFRFYGFGRAVCANGKAWIY